MFSLIILFLVLMVLPINGIYQSIIELSQIGLEYQPKNYIQLISTKTIQSRILCSSACNQLPSCRIFDYDSLSKRCRLFQGDLTIGSIISSSSSTSIVGTVRISSTLYSSSHNQPCQSCQQNRYEVCSTNTNTCQCPDQTFWTGTVCALQLFENDTCQQWDSCRSDFNLTCMTNCYGEYSKCLPAIFDNTTVSSATGFGITVAGGCNGNASTNQTILINPASILLGYNNTLYVGDDSNRLLAFELNNRTGDVLRSFSSWPTFLFLDKRTLNIYITFFAANLAYIWPTNKTIPPSGISYNSCSRYWLYKPTGIVVDSVGNVYISSYACNWVMKWSPNATNGIVIAGSSTGSSGSDSQSFYSSDGLVLDESNSFLYVTDRLNNRIQRFVLGGSGIGVTIAGGNGAGAAANQLNHPIDIYLSKIDGSLYIVDCFNNRIQKWPMNATSGITVAGSPTGISGNTPYLLNVPCTLAIDNEENYLYVSDSHNNRIQRFRLH